MRYTLKQIKVLIKHGHAYDISTINEFNFEQLKKSEIGFNTIAVSMGIHGANGALFEGCTTGRVFAIIKRNTNLMKLVK